MFNNIEDVLKNDQWHPVPNDKTNGFTVDKYLLSLFQFLYCDDTDMLIKEKVIHSLEEDPNSIIHSSFYGYTFDFLAPPEISAKGYNDFNQKLTGEEWKFLSTNDNPESYLDYFNEKKFPVFLNNFIEINSKFPILNKFFDFNNINKYEQRLTHKYDSMLSLLFKNMTIENKDNVTTFLKMTQFDLFTHPNFISSTTLDDGYSYNLDRDHYFKIAGLKTNNTDGISSYIIEEIKDKESISNVNKNAFFILFSSLINSSQVETVFESIANKVEISNERIGLTEKAFEILLLNYKNANSFNDIHHKFFNNLQEDEVQKIKDILISNLKNQSKTYSDLYDSSFKILDILQEKMELKKSFEPEHNENTPNLRKRL